MLQTSRVVPFEEGQVVVARGDEGARVDWEHAPGIRTVEIDLQVPRQLPRRFLLPARLVFWLDGVEFD